jgi:hypothetical protein
MVVCVHVLFCAFVYVCVGERVLERERMVWGGENVCEEGERIRKKLEEREREEEDGHSYI